MNIPFIDNLLVQPKSPRLGPRSTVRLTVHAQFADGEIGFKSTMMSVNEPENGQTIITLPVVRDGTLHRASLSWSIIGADSGDDVLPTSGSLVFEKGSFLMFTDPSIFA